MNPVLAQVYGLDKTASEEEGQATLDTISAADLLAAHQAGQVDINDFLVSDEDPEKTAGLDLSQFSEEDLQQALGELDETQKLASSEEQYWDAAGRQMARGYADEQTKQASTELPMDLNELSAEEIIGLAYELTDEMDKTANEYEDDEIDLNAMTPEEIIELAYHLEGEGYEKTAGAYDLNEFSVDDFISFAADLEMEKEAGVRDWSARQARAAQAQGLKAWQYAKGKGQGARKGVKGHYSSRWERGGKRGEGMVMKHLQKRRAKGKNYSEAMLKRIQGAQRGMGRAAEFTPEAAGVGALGYGAHKYKNRK